MSAAGAFGVVGMDRAAVHGGDRILDVSALVERIGVDGHLHVETIGDAQRGADRSGSRAPVLVNLQAAGSGLDLFFERLVHRAVAGSPSIDSSMRSMFQRPEVMVVPLLPSVGPIPPPNRVVIPLLRQA